MSRGTGHDGLDAVLAAVSNGDLEAAAQRCRQITTEEPEFALGHHYLGTVLSLSGDADAARAASLRAVDIDPSLYKAHFNLGVMAEGADDGEALDRYRTVLELSPDHFGALINLGNVLSRLGDYDEAIRRFSRAAELEPKNPLPHNNLGSALLRYDKPEQAVRSLRKALSIDPTYDEARLNLASALNAAGQPGEAVRILERHLETSPAHAEAENALGVIARDNGDMQSAKAWFRAAVSHRPDYALAYGNLADVARLKADDPVFADLLAVRNDLPEGGTDRIALDFACAGVFDRSGMYEEAFAALMAANRARRSRVPFDPARRRNQIDRLVRHFSGTGKPAATGTSMTAPVRPVFIVGMPRSGTTLLEQMLCAHDAITTVGENRKLGDSVSALWSRLGTSYPAGLDDLPQSELARLADEYIDHLAKAANGHTFVIDKMPNNYLHVGLICRLFPTARVIHMRRDPADNCLSLLFADFGTRMGYSYDQQELSEAFRDYVRLADCWDTCFGDRMLAVQYEHLVAEPEPGISRVLDYLGLEFDPACLRPHDRDDHIRTASVIQVRQPINTSSVGRWRRYEKLLSPAILGLRKSSPVGVKE
ncbi:MAG: sulfotransferase [Rhodospirillales bacterium]